MTQHAADVRDAQAVLEVVRCEQPEVVFHLAAQPMVRRSLRRAGADLRGQRDGDRQRARGRPLAGPSVRAAVIVTSDKCYENERPGSGAFVESDRLGGRDPYSSSKACAELVTAAYRRSFFADPAAPGVASARAGNVIGGGDWGEDRLLADAVRAVEAGHAAARPQPGRGPSLAARVQRARRLPDARPGAVEGSCPAGAWNSGPPRGGQERGMGRGGARQAVGGGVALGARPPSGAARGLLSGDRLGGLRTGARLVAPLTLERSLELLVDWHVAAAGVPTCGPSASGQLEQLTAARSTPARKGPEESVNGGPAQPFACGPRRVPTAPYVRRRQPRTAGLRAREAA